MHGILEVSQGHDKKITPSYPALLMPPRAAKIEEILQRCAVNHSMYNLQVVFDHDSLAENTISCLMHISM